MKPTNLAVSLQCLEFSGVKTPQYPNQFSGVKPPDYFTFDRNFNVILLRKVLWAQPEIWWRHCNYSYNLQVQVTLSSEIETFRVHLKMTWTRA